MTQFMGIMFPFQIGTTSFPAMSADEGLIKESLKQIIQTPMGSRVMRPTFGSEVLGFLFEPNDDVMAQGLAYETRRAIGTWEPRVSVTDVQVVRDTEKGSAIVTVEYIIPSLGKKDHVTIPIAV